MGAKYRDIVQAHSKAKRGARAILNVIANYADSDGIAWPGYDTIADDAGVTTRTVERNIKTLIELGELEMVGHHGGHSGQYQKMRVTLSPNGASPPDKVTGTSPDNLSSSPDKNDISTRQFDNLHPTKTTSSLYIEPYKEPKDEPIARVRARTRPIRRRVESPYFAQSDFDDRGYVPANSGKNAVQVYYERFEISRDRARLTPIQEDDLIYKCKDLERLRLVVEEYSQTSYQPGNVSLILNWYQNGTPNEKHANPATNGNGRMSKPDANLMAVDEAIEIFNRHGVHVQ